MPRKSTKKAATSEVVSSPRRSSRTARRKKSESEEESTTDKLNSSVEVQDEKDNKASRVKRTVPSATAEPSEVVAIEWEKEWKEDEKWWGGTNEENKVETCEAKSSEDNGSVWKVQSSNGAGGEIQKLRICRQKPSSGGESLSPNKDTASPTRKKNLNLDSNIEHQSPSSTVPDQTEQVDVTQADSSVTESTDIVEKVEIVSNADEGHEEKEVPSQSDEPVQIQESIESVDDPISQITVQDVDDSKFISTDIPNSTVIGNEETIIVIEEIKESQPVDSSSRQQFVDGNSSSSDSDSSDSSKRRTKRSRYKEDGDETNKEIETVENKIDEQIKEEVKDLDDTKEEGEIVEKSDESEILNESTDQGEEKLDISRKLTIDKNDKDKNRAQLSLEKVTLSAEEEKSMEDQKEKPKHARITAPSASPPRSKKTLVVNRQPGDIKLTPVRQTSIEEVKGETPAQRKRRLLTTKRSQGEGLVSISTEILKVLQAPAPTVRPLREKTKMNELDVSPTKLREVESKPAEIETKIERVSAKKRLSSIENDKGDENNILLLNKTTDAPTKVIRKISIVSSDDHLMDSPIIAPVAAKNQRLGSPDGSDPTPILYISNLVRPFTAAQLKELLARTGTIDSNGFFIDKIKSKCYVKYTDVEMAIETKHAINGVRWPVNNPKSLKVVFAKEETMKKIQNTSVEGQLDFGWLDEQTALQSSKRTSNSVREWDVGKVHTDENNMDGNHFKNDIVRGNVQDNVKIKMNNEVVDWRSRIKEKREEAMNERERDLRKRRNEERRSPLDRFNVPNRKLKKETEAPAKLLDELFRKTKAAPCIYWLPLSPAQIAVKEEMRRIHMAEHERRLSERKKNDLLREKERERERERDRERNMKRK